MDDGAAEDRAGQEVTGTALTMINANKRFGGGMRGSAIPKSVPDNHWLGISTSATDAIEKAYR